MRLLARMIERRLRSAHTTGVSPVTSNVDFDQAPTSRPETRLQGDFGGGAVLVLALVGYGNGSGSNQTLALQCRRNGSALINGVAIPITVLNGTNGLLVGAWIDHPPPGPSPAYTFSISSGGDGSGSTYVGAVHLLALPL